MTLLTEYPIEGSQQTLLVANIHALNVVPVIDQAKQLWDVEKILKKHQGPIVFAGDFNTWSWGKVETMKRVMRRLGLTEVTFFPDLRRLLLGEIIDYIFIKDLEVIESQVFSVQMGSDHPAMTVRLRYTN
jgi:endonuclease/exonuclease/phosphatase (EEP) superfamily protein YafD